MFNFNSAIEEHRRRRDRALAALKGTTHSLEDSAKKKWKEGKEWSPVQDLVGENPWEACAVAFGAGLLAPAFAGMLKPGGPSAQPQTVVVEVKGAQGTVAKSSVLPSASAPSLMDLAIQALTLFAGTKSNIFNRPTEPSPPSDGVQKNGAEVPAYQSELI